MKDWNAKIIEEFRANNGRVGGELEDFPVLILTTVGVKSGRRHTTPLVYLSDNKRMLIVASYGGAPTNPDWYYNLLANPLVTVEVGTDMFEATATVVAGEEYDELFSRIVEVMPLFGEYQKRTTRVIPVIALQREISA